jgi:glycosyltransferase involved in cell wall biosynthesis
MGSLPPKLETPKASVVVPCFNSGSTIAKTIDSIRTQSYSNIEILIVDDGSEDFETLAILKTFSIQGIRVIRHQENLGLPAARNSGFRAATGLFVLFLDSDDWYAKEAMEVMIERALSSSQPSFVFTDLILEGQRSGILERSYRSFTQLMINRIPCSILVSKNSFADDNLYDESLTLGLEDWDFNLSLISKGFKPIRIGIPLFHYSVSSQGMLLSTTQKNFFSVWRQIRAKHDSLYSLRSIVRTLRLEISSFGLSSVFPGSIMLLLSIFPCDRLLSRVLGNFLLLKRRF